jgi:hypothetical protein
MTKRSKEALISKTRILSGLRRLRKVCGLSMDL